VEEHLTREEVVKLITDGKIPVAKFMTHSWPLAQFKEASEAIYNGSAVKLMLTMV
jgi:threonine dehydrogenase-like Zn-dependent dehydrogenase